MTDTSGINTLRFVKNGSVQAGISLNGKQFADYQEASFTYDRSTVDKIIVGAGSLLTLSRVNVSATDVHGNTYEREYVGASAIPQFAKVLSDLPTVSIKIDNAVGVIAFFDGAIWGIKDTVVGLVELVKNPEQLVSWIPYITELPKVIGQMPTLVTDFQDKHNPYLTDSPHYAVFGLGWLTGYVLGMVAGEVILSKGLGLIKSLPKVSKLVNIYRGGKVVAKSAAFRWAAKTAVGVSKKTPLSSGTARQILRTVPIGEQRQVAHQLQSMSDEWKTFKQAAPDGAVRAGNVVARFGKPGKDLLSWMARNGKDAALRTFLSMEDRAAMQRTLVRALDENPDVGYADVGEALRRYDSLGTPPQKRVYRDLLMDTGGDGVAFTSRLDPDSFEGLMSLRRTARADGGRSVPSDVQTVIQRELSDLPDDELNARIKAISQKHEDLDSPRAKDGLVRAIEESREDGIYLTEEVSAARLTELADRGIDLKHHADGLGIYRRSGKTAGDSGELTELFAQERLVRPKFGPSEDVYPPREVDSTSVEISDSTGNQLGEVDGLTVNDRTVAHLIEIKKHPEKAVDARNQLELTIEKIQDRGVGSGTSFRIDEKADFSSLSKDKETIVTIGPRDAKTLDTPQSNYDYYLEFSQDELKALSDTIQSEGI